MESSVLLFALIKCVRQVTQISTCDYTSVFSLHCFPVSLTEVHDIVLAMSLISFWFKCEIFKYFYVLLVFPTCNEMTI